MSDAIRSRVDALAVRSEDDPAKARVIGYIRHLVAADLAIWCEGATGEIEVHLTSGETYVLGDTAVLRVA
jgi:hypothetical protein